MNQGTGALRIKAILFDKDGTLLDFRGTWLAAYRGVAAELAVLAGGGPALAEALLRRHGYDPHQDRFTPESPLLWASTAQQAALWAAEPELAGVTDVHARVKRHFSDHEAYPPIPVIELAPLFDRLRARGLRLGLATMDDTDAGLRTLARFGVRDRVDFVVGADGGHGLKPEPGMVLAFCQAVGVAPGEVAVVGDTVADLAMARAAGAGLAVAVLTGGCPREALAVEADLVLASIVELERALEGRIPGAGAAGGSG